MTKRMTLIVILLIFFSKVCLSKTIRIYITPSDYNFFRELKSISKNLLDNITIKYSSSRKNSDIIITRTKFSFISENRRNSKNLVVSVGMFYFEVYKFKHIIKDFLFVVTKDPDIKSVVSYFNFQNKSLCVISHYKQEVPKNIRFFYVPNTSSVPVIINRILNKCDVLIGVPDNVVYNYFTTRFIVKQILLRQKTFVTYGKSMKNLGVVKVYYVSKNSYIKRIAKVLIKIFLKEEKFTSHIIRPTKDDISSD